MAHNPLVRVLGDYLRDPQHWLRNLTWRFPGAICDRRMVFVVGAPRSGTTLLQRVLAVHSGFFTIPEETGLFSHQNIFTRRHFGLSDRDTRRLLDGSQDIVDFLDRGIAHLEQERPGRIFVEKTPQHVLAIPFIRRHFPRAAVVHLLRDGRDCFCSARAHPDIPQRHSVAAFARYWRRCVRAGCPAVPDPGVFQMRYERFAEEPEAETRRLMDHLGHPLEAVQTDPLRIAEDRRSAVDAFRKLNAPIDAASCGRWRHDLSPEHAATFLRIAGRELQRLGYA